jgi:transcriptional regulatory protein LevR
MKAIIIWHAHCSVKYKFKTIINLQRSLTLAVVLDIKLDILIPTCCSVERLVNVYDERDDWKDDE